MYHILRSLHEESEEAPRNKNITTSEAKFMNIYIANYKQPWVKFRSLMTKLVFQSFFIINNYYIVFPSSVK